MTGWEPATEAEIAMRDALRAGGQEGYFRILADTELLLPVSADALAGRAPMGWGTWTTSGRTHVLAFTSHEALQACLAEHAGSARKLTYRELAASWPNVEWWLAINPGLPIEGYLPAWFVAQLARGDTRLPGRQPGQARGDTPSGKATVAAGSPMPGGRGAFGPAVASAAAPVPPPAGLPPLAVPPTASSRVAVPPPPAVVPPAPAVVPSAPPAPAAVPSGSAAAPPIPTLTRSGLPRRPTAPVMPGYGQQGGTPPPYGATHQEPNPLAYPPPPAPLAPQVPPESLLRSPGTLSSDTLSRRPGLVPPESLPRRPGTGPSGDLPRRTSPETGVAFGAEPLAAAAPPAPLPPPPTAPLPPPPTAPLPPTAPPPPTAPAAASQQPEASQQVIVDPSFVPANEVEEALLAAAGDGSTDSFLSTLLLAKVLVPVPEAASTSVLPGDEGFVWRTETIDGDPYILVFTSPERLGEHFTEPVATISVKFIQVIKSWPDSTWSFAVNPATPVGATLPGAQILALATWAADVGLGTENDIEEEQPEPAHDEPVGRVHRPAPEDTTRPTVMQKVVRPDQVDYYLDRGYDRVSGFVHRAAEVAHLRTPGKLVAALGLRYAGSPFGAEANDIYVLRWPAYRPSLYRIPYGGQSEAAMRAMEGWVIERPPFRGNGFAPGDSSEVVAEFKVDSARLPHGAQLWCVSADGTEKLIASLDSDRPVWRRAGED